jgi:prepilin-type N-terminal cleavage/methylation domain-containing protein
MRVAERRARTFNRQARGFTLIEATVVVIIIAIAAGLVVPRMFGAQSRLAQAEAQQVRSLLSIAGERSTLTMQPVAIEFVADTRTLSMLIPRPASAGPGNLTRGSSTRWRPDPLVEQVVFENIDLKVALADGRPMESQRWLVTFPAGQARAGLVLRVVPRGKSEPVTELSLGPADIIASISGSDVLGATTSASARAIDLDAIGRGTKPW